MHKKDKIFAVEDVSARIKAAKAIALADYSGINVLQISQLRDKVKQAGGTLQVVKNNLLARALKENNYQIEKTDLNGQNITLFAEADEVSAIKILAAFSKTSSLLPFKMGFMAGKILTKEELSKFASLPPRIELQAKLVSMLASQPRRLVCSLNWNLQKLVLVINGIKNKKQ